MPPDTHPSKSDVDFTVTVEHGRAGRCRVGAYASDPVGAVAAEAAERLGIPPGMGEQCTLAQDGIRLHYTDRMGFPANRIFRLVITGGVV